jgi:hypothetical protein
MSAPGRCQARIPQRVSTGSAVSGDHLVRRRPVLDDELGRVDTELPIKARSLHRPLHRRVAPIERNARRRRTPHARIGVIVPQAS